MPTLLTNAMSAASQWLGVTSTLVATATAIFTTQLAVSVNERNARDRFFERQLQACTDLGDASLPVQNGLNEIGAAFLIGGLGQKEVALATRKHGDAMVSTAYDEYQKITTRLYVLYPDSFVPLEAKVSQYMPPTLGNRADASAQPEATFKTLHDGFSDADIKLRAACTSYLRGYAKANLIKPST